MNRDSPSTVTGWRKADAAVCGVLAALVLIGGLRLRVYYRVTVTEISVERVAAGETRRLDTPAALDKTLYAFGSHVAMLDATRDRIAAFMADAPPPYCDGEAGTVVRWTVRYAYNRLDLDQQFTMEFDGAGRPR